MIFASLSFLPRQIHSCPFLETILLSFVPQIGLSRSKIDNFRAAISVLFHLGTFFAVKRVRNSFVATNDTSTLETSEIALVTDGNKSAGSDVGIADDALAIVFLAESPNSHSRLFSAED